MAATVAAMEPDQGGSPSVESEAVALAVGAGVAVVVQGLASSSHVSRRSRATTRRYDPAAEACRPQWMNASTNREARDSATTAELDILSADALVDAPADAPDDTPTDPRLHHPSYRTAAIAGPPWENASQKLNLALSAIRMGKPRLPPPEM